MKIPLLIIAAISAATSFPLTIRAVASIGVAALTYLVALTYIVLLFLLLVRPIARHINRQIHSP